MGKMDIKKGQILHQRYDQVNTVEIILKGGIAIKGGEDISIPAGQGTILGACYQPGEQYYHDYVASEDSIIVTYDYSSEDDLIAVMMSTPSILPIMASANMGLLNRALAVLAGLYEQGCALCADLKADYSEYREVCAGLMIQPERYDEIDALVLPEAPAILSGWQADLCRSYREKDELLRKVYYPADVNFCVGTIMNAAQLAHSVQPRMELAINFIRETKANAADFIREYHMQKAKLDEAKRQEKLGAGSGKLPAIVDALNTILAFAGIDTEVAEAFRRDIRAFMKEPDKSEKSDDMRRIRRNITQNFYAIYEAAFFKSQTMTDIPVEVKMFFLFGFVDEELAGRENTAALYKYAVLWEDDPSGTVLSAYDWLCMIYRGEAQPSKNELDTDWSEYLREQVRTSAMTQEAADALLVDGTAMVRFELSNMIAAANKMTYGNIFSFIPAFYEEAVVRPIEECFASPKRVHEALDKVRAVDYSCFYRQTFKSYPELKINRFDYHVEVLPYIILMPNFGRRGSMWQEIEGRRRTTPAHMVLSVFHSENLDDTILRMCGQFRWEMCKRIQGVHYSDITDPSLTADYGNYLQFYRKNHDLSDDVKEKVKLALRRNSNNYRNVFVADYELFIKNEALGLPRLNKVAREILFRYCTFSRKYREALSLNPQYQPLMERWNVKQGTKDHLLDVFTRKIQTMTDRLPTEVRKEAEFMKM